MRSFHNNTQVANTLFNFAHSYTVTLTIQPIYRVRDNAKDRRDFKEPSHLYSEQDQKSVSNQKKLQNISAFLDTGFSLNKLVDF